MILEEALTDPSLWVTCKFCELTVFSQPPSLSVCLPVFISLLGNSLYMLGMLSSTIELQPKAIFLTFLRIVNQTKKNKSQNI